LLPVVLQAACQFSFNRKTAIYFQYSGNPAVFDRGGADQTRQKLPAFDKVLTVGPYQWHPE
jgi:hypothetical protein